GAFKGTSFGFWGSEPPNIMFTPATTTKLIVSIGIEDTIFHGGFSLSFLVFVPFVALNGSGFRIFDEIWTCNRSLFGILGQHSLNHRQAERVFGGVQWN